MTSENADPTPSPPTFDILPLSRELRQAIDELGYTHPTPVQREVFEPASRGRDLVVQARTGTGKTAAFGMPVIDSLIQRSLAAVQAVILCPTRELALQVHREIDTLGRHRGVKSVAVYGGAPMARQVEELGAGAQVLVGTPGRVLDHLRRGSLNPRDVRTFILDESDEMLSMGFLPQINEIHGYLPPNHQALLFSATLPPDIQRHAETRLKDPLFLTLSGDQIGALDIQHFVYMTCGDKLKDFIQVLEVENPESAIVFCNTRDETKRVAAALDRLGFAADWLNADLAQNEREKVMAATRGGQLRFLVCTDVAARGIDISHLTHVINFDLPESAESYVHRTGRTGRAGRTGTAISLIEPTDIGNLYMLRLTYKIFPIERQLPTAGERRTRQELDVVELFEQAFSGRRVHADDLSLARRLMTHGAGEQIVACLLRDHLGARPEAAREGAEARRAKTSIVQGPSTSSTKAPTVGRKDRTEETSSGSPPNSNKSPVAVVSGRACQEPRKEVTPPSVPGRSSNSRGDNTRPVRALESELPKRRAIRELREQTVVPEQVFRDDDFEFGYTVSEVSPSVTISKRDAAAAGSAERSSTSAERSSTSAERSSTSAERNSTSAERNSTSAERNSTSAERNSTSAERNSTSPGTVEIFVSVGRIDGAKFEDFRLLLEQAGIAVVDPSLINLRRNHCFVQVPAADFRAAEAALNGATIAGKVAFAERSRARRA